MREGENLQANRQSNPVLHIGICSKTGKLNAERARNRPRRLRTSSMIATIRQVMRLKIVWSTALSSIEISGSVVEPFLRSSVKCEVDRAARNDNARIVEDVPRQRVRNVATIFMCVSFYEGHIDGYINSLELAVRRCDVTSSGRDDGIQARSYPTLEIYKANSLYSA